jgi:hypothetical protein
MNTNNTNQENKIDNRVIGNRVIEEPSTAASQLPDYQLQITNLAFDLIRVIRVNSWLICFLGFYSRSFALIRG